MARLAKGYSTRRKFNGEAFKFVDRYNYISEAIALKQKLKSKGYKVRMIKTVVHGYEVWGRR